MEPIICNLGAVVPGREFVCGARKLCTRYGTLFVPMKWQQDLAGLESSSPANTLMSSLTSCASRRRSLEGLVVWVVWSPRTKSVSRVSYGLARQFVNAYVTAGSYGPDGIPMSDRIVYPGTM